MATSGKIFHQHTTVEIDEAGRIWLIQNHFESSSVIEEMQASANGITIVEKIDSYDEFLFDGDDA